MAETLNLRGTLKGCVSRPSRRGRRRRSAAPTLVARWRFRFPHAAPQRVRPVRGSAGSSPAPRDKTIKLWNTLGECKYTIQEDGHTEWVSCVRFSPSAANPLIVSCGWDKLVKVWNLTNCKLRTNLVGHTGYLNTVTVSPDGSLCASGGKDGTAMLWDLNEGKHLYSLEANAIIHAMVFSPNRYWLCAATESCIKIWDLESKSIVDELNAGRAL